ncbi:MAG: SDR family NAD(P)-dependent oxidoreductase [Mycobacteriaceae bacterium]
MAAPLLVSREQEQMRVMEATAMSSNRTTGQRVRKMVESNVGKAFRVTLKPVPSPRSLLAALNPSYGRSVQGKRVLITGASSGIGEATAHLLAQQGAQVVLVARRLDELTRVQEEIVAQGGHADIFSCDVTEENAVIDLVAALGKQMKSIDILINNAGHSIRRPVVNSFDRMHDFERTIALNYLSPVRMTLKLLPMMLSKGDGHIINVTTWGVSVMAMPNFAAYGASKSALAMFGRSLDAELRGKGIHVSSIGFPLVRTPMIAPTTEYNNIPTLTAEEAAQWILTAIRTRPTRMVPRYVAALGLFNVLAPGTLSAIMGKAQL